MTSTPEATWTNPFPTPVTNKTTYLAGFQYKDNQLEFFPHAEGYVKVSPGGRGFDYSYVFNYTDHLGNVRVSYSDIDKNGILGSEHKQECPKQIGSTPPPCQDLYVSAILEESHYYPFGLKHEGYNSNNAQPNYNYKYQGQERQTELNLNWDSFKWRNYDYAIGRFMSVDPLAPDFPQWSPYVFSGNLVTISKELEGMEPEFLVNSNGKLTSSVVSLMHAAYGYSTSSLENSTWIINTDPRVTVWDNLTGHPEASVKGTQVMYSSKVVNKDENYWFGLISHEQSHRQDVEKEGNLNFYPKYLIQGAVRKYKDIDTEVKAFAFGSDDFKIDTADKLLAYKGGIVMDIFQRGNLSDNEKASMLETVGNQFKRDVILQGNIDGAKTGLKTLNDTNWDDKTKASMKSLLNVLIKNWTKQQQEITATYGQ